MSVLFCNTSIFGASLIGGQTSVSNHRADDGNDVADQGEPDDVLGGEVAPKLREHVVQYISEGKRDSACVKAKQTEKLLTFIAMVLEIRYKVTNCAATTINGA